MLQYSDKEKAICMTPPLCVNSGLLRQNVFPVAHSVIEVNYAWDSLKY